MGNFIIMRPIIIFCLLLVSTLSYSKGRSGKYYIAGTAYDENKRLLANALIEVQFKGQMIFVYTDGEGKYKLIIEWSTACPTHLTRSEHRKLTKNSNPKWINLACDNKTIKIKNRWRRYSWTSTEEERRLTRSKDLKFDS